MRIRIGNATQRFMDLLKIESYPFTEKELKTKFRGIIQVIHPDKSNGDHEVFIRVKEAYDSLLPLAIDLEEEKRDHIKKLANEKEELFNLTKPCDHCNGLGKQKVIHRESPCLCQLFEGTGLIFFKTIHRKKCYDCNGSGIFTLRSGRKVKCRKCDGSGYLKCKICNGTGTIGKNETTEIDCTYCGGTGKIILKPFNPVIPKGGVLF